MSRQSKNTRKLALARSFKGTKGPATTEPKHGKKRERRSPDNVYRGPKRKVGNA